VSRDTILALYDRNVIYWGRWAAAMDSGVEGVEDLLPGGQQHLTRVRMHVVADLYNTLRSLTDRPR
jgi:hypothetical protein